MIDRRSLLSGAVGATLVATAADAADAAASTSPPGAAATPAAAASPWTRRGTVRRAGGVIGYAIAGQGPTLVAMPKLGGWIDDWVPLARELARDHRLIAIDPPGHGSSRMDGEPPTVQTLAESAAMVRATLEELEITDFVLMGNSLGGCIAAAMAGLWPRLASHLVLISVAVYAKDPLAKIIADQANADPPIYAPNGDPLPRTRETAMGRFNMSAEFTDEMNRSRMAAGRWIRASERGVRSEGLAELVQRIEVPTLLVYSDGGTYLRHRITAEKLLRNHRTVTIAGAGAFIHQEKPADTARAIREFLRA